jgi:hypothetical protein
MNRTARFGSSAGEFDHSGSDDLPVGSGASTGSNFPDGGLLTAGVTLFLNTPIQSVNRLKPK